MTMMLVHGGGFGASCWDLMLPYLEGDVRAIDLPGRGTRPAPLGDITIADFVDAVVDDIVSNDLTDVLLVGHSLAGITMPGVAGRVPERLRRLVFVSCTVPDDGTSIFDTLDPEIQAISEGNAAGENSVLSPEMAKVMFCNDMDDDQTQWTIDHLVAEAMGVTYEPVDLAGLRGPVPRTWVRLLQDAIVPPVKQDRWIENIGGADVIDLDVGHMAMITAPKELAEILNQLR